MHQCRVGGSVAGALVRVGASYRENTSNASWRSISHGGSLEPTALIFVGEKGDATGERDPFLASGIDRVIPAARERPPRQSYISGPPEEAIVGQLAAGRTHAEILGDFPELEEADIYAALEFAAPINGQMSGGRMW